MKASRLSGAYRLDPVHKQVVQHSGRSRIRRGTLIGIGACLLGCALQLGADEPATSLLSLKLIPNNAGLLAVLEADGTLQYRVGEEENPARRLVLDLPNVNNPLRHYYAPETHPLLERVLMYEYPGSAGSTGPLARVVFELKLEVPHSIARAERELQIQFLTGDDVPAVPAVAGGPVNTTANGLGNVTATGGAVPLEVAAELPPDPNRPDKFSIEPEDVSYELFFAPAASGPRAYRLGAEDVIEVRVFELDQLNRTLRVSGDGFIDLPLVGSIQTTGLTADDVAAEVASRLQDRYVQNPQVSIFIKEFQSQRVSLLGAVNTPASYPLMGQRRLLQVLAEAGSLSAEAGSVLYVFRATPDGRSARLTVPLNELLVNGDPRWNILLYPGDVVTVPPAEAISISVLGAVNQPGVYKLPVGQDATLLTAIARAGGLNERAAKKGVQVKRKTDAGGEEIIKINLGNVLAGKEPDLILLEGDVVVVNESFF